MTFSPVNSLAFQLPENFVFSQDYRQFLVQLTDLYQKLARASNAKDIGIYSLNEIQNGQQFFSANPQKFNQTYRKTFSFGAIGAGVTLNIAHGITGFTQFTRIYGTCITKIVDYRPIPFASATLVTDQIQVTVTAANAIIVNGVTAPNITSGILVLEYLKS